MPFICVQMQSQVSDSDGGEVHDYGIPFIFRSRRGCSGRGIAPTRDSGERPAATPSHQPMGTSSHGLGVLWILFWPTKPQTRVLDILPLRWAITIRSTTEGWESRRQTLSGLFARGSLLSSASTRRRGEIVKLFRANLAGKRALPRSLDDKVGCL